MSQDFKTGDVVHLKSGGPQMTIEGIDTYDEGAVMADCVWFDDKKVRQNALFKLETLERDTPMEATSVNSDYDPLDQ